MLRQLKPTPLEVCIPVSAIPVRFDDVSIYLLERPGPVSDGHSKRASVVNVVSRQFDSVLVEQNHCHGLKTVKKSC